VATYHRAIFSATKTFYDTFNKTGDPMKRALLFAFLLSACDASVSAVAAVGISGTGPHQGIVQEKQGVKVELVPMQDGTVRAYLTDASGQPQKATGEIKMTIAADSFSPTEVVMAPAENGSYLVAKLPGPAPKTPAEVSLAFPAGVNFQYQGVPFAGATIAPEIAVAAPTVAVGVPASFVAPHGGTVTRVGDNLVEVVIMPKGEVQTYAYTIDAQPIPVSEVSVPEIEIQYQKKPYKVKMKPHESDAYLVGYIDAKVEIPAHAEVIVACPKPVKIKGVIYEPTVVVFTPFIVATPVIVVSPLIITPIVPGIFIEVGHSHHSGHYNYGSKHGGKHGGKHH
jgi:hypothetical protein